MKKLFIFLALTQCLIMFGQIENKAVPGGSSCISGSLTINVGQTVTFTSANDAQCSQCYDWDINGNSTSSDNSTVGTLQIVGTDMNKSVSIKGISAGSGTINLTYFDETGCHNCTLNVNVTMPLNCLAPVLTSTFQCSGPGSYAHGIFSITNISSVDLNAISSINIELNGADFNGAGFTGNNITLMPPYFSNFNFPIKDSDPECYYGNDFGATVTFNYNNGCGSIQTSGVWYDYNTPPKPSNESKISVYPNPTNSVIEFKGQNLNNSFITIYESNTGNVIVNKYNLNNKIDISKHNKGIYLYKIESENKVIQEGKILKQ